MNLPVGPQRLDDAPSLIFNLNDEEEDAEDGVVDEGEEEKEEDRVKGREGRVEEEEMEWWEI